MASWKKVIVSGSNAHLTSVTASQVPTGTTENVLLISTAGEVRQVSQATLTGQSVLSFVTMSVGGLGGSTGTVFADGASDNLIISSSDANLTITTNSGTDTLTFDFADSPSFTNITASGNISGSGNLSITGTSTLTGRLTANGAITTTNITASGNISSSAGLTGQTLTTSGGATVGGDLAVNGGDITTTFTGNARIFDGNLTQLDLGGGATTVNIGGSTTQTNFNGSVNLGGDSNDSVNVYGLFALGDGLLNSDLIPFADNAIVIGSSSKEIKSIVVNQITSSGNISSSAGLIGATLTTSGTATIGGRLSANGALTTTTITASATPEITSASLSGLHILLVSSSGEFVKVATLPSGNVAGINSFSNITIGGVTVTADSSADILTINSGSFAGSANTNNNLLISASQDDVITFSFNDSPRFTNITASGNISGSGNLSITGNETIGGTSTITGRLTANGAITTTNITASGNISSSAGLIGATLNTSGNGTIGGNLTTTQITASGNISSSAGLIGQTLTTSGAATIGTTLAVATNATVGGNLTVTGDLTVNGDTTIINTTNISIEDKFILLASGSGTTTDGGIIVQTTSGSSGISTGSALFYNGTNVPADGSARWGLNNNVVHNATTVTPTDYLVSVSASTANPLNTAAGAPTYGSASAGFGNVHINTSNNTIWMYI
jgi:hypothetical protein